MLAAFAAGFAVLWNDVWFLLFELELVWFLPPELELACLVFLAGALTRLGCRARVSEAALSVRVVEMVAPLSARGSPALLTFRYAGF